MASRTIVGTFTYSTQALRDTAHADMLSALGEFSYVPFASNIGSGVNTPTATTMTVSITIDDRDVAFNVANLIYDAAILKTSKSSRNSSGFLSVNRI